MKIKNVINLTPHPVIILLDKGEINNYESQGSLRLSTSTIKIDNLDDRTPISITKFGDLVDAPQVNNDTMYIVSSIICNANRDRADFFIPDQIVRNENGKIIGCRSLTQNPFLTRID